MESIKSLKHLREPVSCNFVSCDGKNISIARFIFFILCLLFSDWAWAIDQKIILDWTLNGVSQGEAVALYRDQREILILDSDIEKAGVHLPEGRHEEIGGKSYFILSSVKEGLTYRADVDNFKLEVTVKPEWFASNSLNYALNERPTGIQYRRDSSAWTNYALRLTTKEDLDGAFETGISLGGTLLFNQLQVTPEREVIRGLTNFTVDQREAMRRWILGDQLAFSGQLGSSVVLGGAGFSREFSLDPYFVRFPGTGISGVFLNPTTIDIYVNNSLLAQEKLPPGPFEIKNLPVPVGAGGTRIVARDIFGRQYEITSAYYISSGLLSKGVTEYTYEVGKRRDNLGIQNWEYGPLGFLGLHRIGLNDWITGGLRLEGTSDVLSGGPILTTRLGKFGEFETSVGVSHDIDHGGLAGLAGYNYISQKFGGGFSFRVMSDHYATLGIRAVDDRAILDSSAGFGFPVGGRTSLSLLYSVTNQRDRGGTQRAGATTNIILADHWNLFVTSSHTWQTMMDNYTDAFVGLNYSFGENTNISSTYNLHDSQSTGGLEINKPLPLGEGYGYRVVGNVGATDLAEANLQYQGPYGLYEGDYQYTAGNGLGTVQASGGLVLMGEGKIFPTRPVQDAFALIRVPGVEGVKGYVNNQVVGHTDAEGDLLIPSMLSYYANRLGIADEDIPIGYRIDETELKIAPPYRGGALVNFPVMKVKNVTGKLRVIEHGRSVNPAYGEIRVLVKKETLSSPIGNDGIFYFENLQAGEYNAEIEYEGGICKFILTIAENDESILNLGTLTCTLTPS